MNEVNTYNIAWIKVILTKEEFKEYVKKYPEYLENYYIIK